MDGIGTVISGKKFKEPAEFAIIREFIDKTFQKSVKLATADNRIIIKVNSAAFAGTLHNHIYHLQQLCGTQKRLVIQISA